MFKIKTLNKISQAGLKLLDRQYVCDYDVENPDGILVRSANLHEMPLGSNLKAIARAGAGVNNIPVAKCSAQGIVVFNTPGANANAVMELVIASLLLCSRDIIGGIEWAKTLAGQGEEVAAQIEAGKSAFAGPEIKGKKLGVIGLGAIGVMVANCAHHLEMDVVGYDPYLSVDSAWGLSRFVHKAMDLKEVLTQCDYITVHVPLNDKTRHMMDDAAFSSMKKGVRLLNFARGELVDPDALERHLNSGHVAAYVTDFPNDRLLNMEHVICVPHLGASTPESEENCAEAAVRELMNYLETGNIKNSVNLPDTFLPRSADTRLCILHKNVPNMLSQISACLAFQNINIENMLNKSRQEYAYTIVDVAGDVSPEVGEKIAAIDGIIKVRII